MLTHNELSHWIDFDAVQSSHRSRLASSILLGAAGVVVVVAGAADAAAVDAGPAAAADVGEVVHTADTGRKDQAAVATAASSCQHFSKSKCNTCPHRVGLGCTACLHAQEMLCLQFSSKGQDEHFAP